MKKFTKKNPLLFLIFLAAFALLFFSPARPGLAFASGVQTITFDAGSGTCETASLETNAEGKLDTIPVPTWQNHSFAFWSFNGAVVDTDTEFDASATVVACWKTQSYIISEIGGEYTIEGETTDSNLTYTLATNQQTFADVITQIDSDTADPSANITIYFDTISVAENITLAYKDITLSGTVDLGAFHICLTSTTAASVANLASLNLSSTSALYQVLVSGSGIQNINVSNAEFLTTNATASTAIKFENSGIALNLSNKIIHTTTNLFNFIYGNTTTIGANIDLSEQIEQKLAISLPYTADETIIIHHAGPLYSNNFIFNSESPNYTATVFGKNMNSIIGSTSTAISFNANGGTIENGYESLTVRYKNTSNTNFPDNSVVTALHKSLAGYIAKINISGTDYYFDGDAITAFVNDGATTADAATYFETTLPDSSTTPFSFYRYDNSSTLPEFLAVNFILSENKVPTFVAIWTDTIYSISFNSNGGSEETALNGIFGSQVTLPTPTKTGYSFTHWFDDETLETQISLVTMPDTNPTLYAGWQANNYTLSVTQNNGNSPFLTDVLFGTTLLTIYGVDPDTFSRTGYTFVGWFTNEELTEELEIETMPAETLYLYAKWQINSYTITLYTNFSDTETIHKTSTKDYGESITDMFENPPVFEGHNLSGWYYETSGLNKFNSQSQTTMPAEDITLYGKWSAINYTIKYYYLTNVLHTTNNIHFGDTITLPNNPEIPSYKFIGWFADETLEEPFSTSSMPSHDLNVYAKMELKQVLTLSQDEQVYRLSENGTYAVNSELEGFVVEYFVDDTWTITPPTKIGKYKVRISRNEDQTYQSFKLILDDAFEITADELDISVAILILYILATIEIFLAFVVLFLRLRRKSFISLSFITLPWGLVSKSSFTHLIIASVLCLFGFVLFTIELVKFIKLNNNIGQKLEEEDEERKLAQDKSEDEEINKKVDEILAREGFINVKPRYKKIEVEDILSDDLAGENESQKSNTTQETDE